ncbi:uncharacterized protein (DUF885 family) [Saccharothrix tamanrassetensis]|uniref:Uncharacterized protein (DUF885 family) n=1 Tax=Saccharothrix tamanrassetensis TaxID=1051531 RepID=A0A841CHR8_9PSEU|nr:DUF885 domain-containing protein [Saccharothrix tamanrassetensis]MBB5956849.1 uncharacterized protein (DUF885 family) [Saccharothrix tamanrassetensis]
MTDVQLAGLAAEYFQDHLETDPFAATMYGVPGHDGEVPDPSRDADRRRLARLEGFRRRLDAIDPTGLTGQDTVTHAMLGRLLRDNHAELASGFGSGTAEIAVSASLVGVQNQVFSTVPTVALTDAAGTEAYLRRLRGLSGYFDAAGARYREAVADGRFPTASGARQTVQQLRGYLASDLAGDPFLRPVTGADAERVAAVVRSTVRPALARLADTVSELLPVGRDDDHVGICHVPGGEAAYTAAVRAHTTTELSPAQIHEIGLTKLAEVHEEFVRLGDKVLGTSELPEILRRLRDDERLRFDNADEIVACAVAALERAEVALPQWFHRYEIARCVVEPMHPAEAEGSVLAYYRPPADDGSRPGAHVVNTHLPRSRPRFEYEALSFHESVPGHHLQVALAQSLTDIPDFRRFTYVTAHAEGWGLYTERLADEMGLYTDDLARMGMLSFDAWRACRLVVDTGMHHFGWSRDRARSFLRDNSAGTETNVRNEIDRYIAWPGQATAYLLGRLHIEDLRARATRELGNRFDVKDFHHQVLANGAVPLETLTDIVDRWIAG